MRSDILLKIRNDSNLSTFLKYHSYLYKDLITNPNSITQIEQEMKKEFKLTFADKISTMTEKVEMLRTFMDVFK